MVSYEVTAHEVSGIASTKSTPSTSSTPWAETLRARYGISEPMAPDDGHDEEGAYLRSAVGALS